jgi:hypothetical protein
MTTHIARSPRLGHIALFFAVLGLGLSGAARASGECADDSDCGPGQVCASAPGSCPPCDLSEGSCESQELECDEESDGSICVPSYLAPCEADADCGEGFECVRVACDVPSVGESHDGERPCVDEAGEEGQGYCSLLLIPCESSEECAEGWSCEESYDDSASCGPDEDETCLLPEPGEDSGASYCVPPSSFPDGLVTTEDDTRENGDDTRDTAGPGVDDGQPSDDALLFGCQAAGSAALPGALSLLLFGLGLGRRRR